MRRWIFLALVLAGCGGPEDKCSKTFLALWPGSNGTYDFKEIRLNTLQSPYELKGKVARIYFESGMNEITGFSSPVARPRFTRANGLCVATDVNSALAVSAYAQMEKLYEFDQKLGIAGHIPWPRKIGIQIHVRGERGLSNNNAHYFSYQDVIGFVPYTLNGLPTGVNQGVFAHEHFHAHFQHQVYNRLKENLPQEFFLAKHFHPIRSLKPQPEDVKRADITRPMGLNSFILRAWNEGLADFYAAVFTGRPDFVDLSLPYLSGRRDLSGPLGRLVSGIHFRKQIEPGFGRVLDPVQIAYEQGTVLARLFYRLAHHGMLGPQEFLMQVLSRLPYVASEIAPVFDREVMDFDRVVPILLQGIELDSEACGTLSVTVSRATFARSFARCWAL